MLKSSNHPYIFLSHCKQAQQQLNQHWTLLKDWEKALCCSSLDQDNTSQNHGG